MSAALALSVALAFDLVRRPERQYSVRVAGALIGAYQVGVSPLLSRAGVRCRFVPSCSEYARAAIQKGGVAAGGLRSLVRLSRCGPWTPAGTVSAGLLTRGEDPAVPRRPH